MDPYEAFQQGAATNQPGAPIESLWQAFLRAFYHIWFVRIGEDILSLQAARMRQIQSCLWILLLIFNIVPWLHQAVTAVMIYPCTAAATAPYLNGLCPLVLPLRPPQQGPSPMNIWNPSISPTSSADNISSEIATMLTSHVAICDVGLRLEHQMEKLQKHNATPAQDALIAQLEIERSQAIDLCRFYQNAADACCRGRDAMTLAQRQWVVAFEYAMSTECYDVVFWLDVVFPGYYSFPYIQPRSSRLEDVVVMRVPCFHVRWYLEYQNRLLVERLSEGLETVVGSPIPDKIGAEALSLQTSVAITSYISELNQTYQEQLQSKLWFSPQEQALREERDRRIAELSSLRADSEADAALFTSTAKAYARNHARLQNAVNATQEELAAYSPADFSVSGHFEVETSPLETPTLQAPDFVSLNLTTTIGNTSRTALTCDAESCFRIGTYEMPSSRSIKTQDWPLKVAEWCNEASNIHFITGGLRTICGTWSRVKLMSPLDENVISSMQRVWIADLAILVERKKKQLRFDLASVLEDI